MAHRFIHITGAAGTGVSTLGIGLARRLDLVHIDVDDHYWLPTDPPFQAKRERQDRVAQIRSLQAETGWILSGSLMGWGDVLVRDADLIIFLFTDTQTRLARLRKREKARFGPRILPGGDMEHIHAEFVDWAAQYDVPDFGGRSRRNHDLWLAERSAPILQIDGTQPADQLLQTAKGWIARA